MFVYRNVPDGEPQLLHTLGAPAPQRWEFGYSVAGVEDVDGDGAGDILVGQRGHVYSSIPYPGFAYLFSGATGTLLHTFGVSGPTSSVIGFGEAVAAVPDVNGDGVNDLAVSTGSLYAAQAGGGFVRIYDGASGGELLTVPATFPFSGWGSDLAGVEDLDGDGAGEVLVGAASSNRAPLFSGADGSLLGTLQMPDAEFGALFGFAVDAGGDVNGDGAVDLLVGAPFEDGPNGFDKGRAYLFSGADASLLRVYEPPSSYQPGADFHEYFGRSVLISPDANGDGRADVVVGAPGLNIPNSGNGATFTFFCLEEGAASWESRPGTPPNPEVLQVESEPLIGASFAAAVDHSTFEPDALLDLLLVSALPANVPTAGGTLLVDLTQLLLVAAGVPEAGSLQLPIPSNCALVGLPLSVQGASWDGVQFAATGALDLVVGSF